MESKHDEVTAETFDHFVWATKNRQPMIVPAWEAQLHEYIRTQCETLGVEVYALNGMPDHLHLACSLPPQLPVAEFMQKIKGSSSHFINHLPETQADTALSLYWQPGYGWLTYAKKELPRITAYIDDQKTHHQEGRLWDNLERPSSLIQKASPGRSRALKRRFR